MSSSMNSTTGAASGGLLPLLGELDERDISILALGVLVIILNAMEIVWLMRQRKNWRVFNVILCGMALADFVVGICGIAHGIIALTDTHQHQIGQFSPTEFILAVNAYLSNSFVVLLTADRMVAIVFPLRHRFYVTKRRASIVQVALLVICICLAFGSREVNESRIGIGGWRFIIAPFIVTNLAAVIVMYTVILVSYRRHQRKFKSDETSDSSRSAPTAISSAERRMTVSCLLVVVLFAICFVPIPAILWLPVPVLAANAQLVSSSMYILIIVASLVNPCVYFLRVVTFH